jgi:hypothetical protein
MVRASADYGIGLGDSRDVTEASTAYAQLRVAYFHAKLRHNVALAELARATGTLTSGAGHLYPTRSGQSAKPVQQERTPTDPAPRALP